jgi:RNA polymerase sigma-70 factor (ECF subfamily)
MSDDSLSLWIERWNQGDAAAVERLLSASEPYLRIAVRRRLSKRLRAKIDSMDIVQSVYVNVLKGFRGNGWRFAGRPQLLAFLRQIAWRRLANRYQEHRQALEREQAIDESGPANVADAATPRPSQVAEGREFWERVLVLCPEPHREVVRLRAHGYRMAEIADRTGLHEGSVRRILYDLARRMSLSRRECAGSLDRSI